MKGKPFVGPANRKLILTPTRNVLCAIGELDVNVESVRVMIPGVSFMQKYMVIIKCETPVEKFFE